MKKRIMLLTKNKTKLEVAQSVFGNSEMDIIPANRDYVEIQADTSLEIAKYSALEAAKENNLIVIREDHSLFINFLGLPGPYTQFVERVLSVEKLLKILELSNDRTGFFEIATVVAYPNGMTHDFNYKIPIHIKKEIVTPDSRGGWDSVLCLEGEKRAFTEYSSSERIHVWNKNLKKIAELLKKDSNPPAR